MEPNNKEIKSLFCELTEKRIKSFSKLTGGFSNYAYLINDAYVLKTPKDYVQPFIDYENEHNILLVLADIKNVEKCYYYDYDRGIKISKFIHGSRPYVDEINNSQIILVAKFLKKLHKIKGIDVKPFDPMLRLEVYKSETKVKIDGRYERKICNRVNKIIEKEDQVLCHNDVVRGNLLFSFDKLSVIDWEMAGLNCLYFDLASFISENNLNSEQINLFLTTYFGSSYSSLKLKKVQSFIDFEDLLWYYWANMMFNNTKEEIFEKIAKEKLERINLNKSQANKEQN